MEPDQRPTPEEMLERVRAEETSLRRGKLTIFFGFSPGVGKTYAMLQASQLRRKEGLDVVIGWLEPHGRKETEILAEGIPRIPPKPCEHRGMKLQEMDLEAALSRHPALLVVDELAHTNASGAKHARRWQDVEELLDAGIDIYATLNVQHLESLNDVVAQITGIQVRETVPDSIFEKAHEVKLADVTPDDLLQRLKEGRVYLPSQAERAVENFFKKGNLIALRELSLQRTAERVDAQMARWKRDQGLPQPWLGRDRLLVALDPSAQAADVIRAACRMATRLKAPWIALWVEPPASPRLTPEAGDRIRQHLSLAERLGAEIVVVAGEDPAEAILQVARQHNVTRIIVGKPTRPRWLDRLRGSLVERLARKSGPIDVLVTTGEEAPPEGALVPRGPVFAPTREYLWALAVVLVTTGASWLVRSFLSPADLVMVYLLGILYVSCRSSYGPALLVSFASVAAMDFFFVPPYFSFSVADGKYLFTFVVMLVTGILVSSLTVRLRTQGKASLEREHRTSVLYAMTRSFAFRKAADDIAEAAARHVEILFEAPAVVLVPDASGTPVLRSKKTYDLLASERELAVARWVLEHGRPAGHGTDTLPGAQALYFPLASGNRTLGVLGVSLGKAGASLSASQRQMLDVFANQAALALERALVAEESEQVRLAAETERLRNALLSSVSHDLRTPIAAITGAATSLLDQGASLDSETRHDLLEAIREESERLDLIVRNLLDLTRLESGTLTARKEWCPLEEILDSSMARLEKPLRGRAVKVDLPKDMLMVPADPILLEQVFTNLLENVLKYTPEGTPVDIGAALVAEGVQVSVADRGPGVPVGDLERIFEKFYRIAPDTRVRGTGLGLPICRAVLAAHGGRIWAENREGGGAVFRFLLPVEGAPPRMPEESA